MQFPLRSIQKLVRPNLNFALVGTEQLCANILQNLQYIFGKPEGELGINNEISNPQPHIPPPPPTHPNPFPHE